MTYYEVEDIDRITKLGKKLGKTIQSSSVRSEMRTIGYPGGHTNRKVYFWADDGERSLWFANWPSDKSENKVINLFGHGVVGEARTLTIDVQFNLAKDQFTRRLGGVFLEDRATGDIVLAHRGIVTLGHRVKKDILFDAMASGIIEAETSEGPGEFLFMALLDSPSLVEDLGAFSSKLRSTLQGLGTASEQNDDVVAGNGEDAGEETPTSAPRAGAFGELGAYFSEFSGARRAFTPKKVYPICNHGKVVDALEAQVAKLGLTLKSTEIDLVVNCAKMALLFEVKTNAATQSVYTAVGQLGVHEFSVAKFTGKRVVRVLVVPERPMAALAANVENELGIRLVTYFFNASGGVTFKGLDGL